MTGWCTTWQGKVERDWLDELDHVNFLAYQRIADKGGENFWATVSGGRSFEERGGAECVMIETWVRYLGELRLDDVVSVETALLAFDDKRYQLKHRIKSRNQLACLVETVNLAFNLNTRRSMSFSSEVRERLQERVLPAEAQAELPLKRVGGTG